MNLKYLKIITALFVVATVFSQSRYKADKYFKKLAYVKSAELYKKLYEKGDKSKLVLERLAYSYYKNSMTNESEEWYAKLIESYRDQVTNEELFHYVQSLRANGHYKKSDSLLGVLKAKGFKVKSYSNGSKKNVDFDVCLSNLDINSKYSDFGAYVFNNQLYFATAAPLGLSNSKKLYQWNNQPYLNIYKGNINVDPDNASCKVGSKVKVVRDGLFSENLSTQYHESNPVFTKDGKKVYFTRVNCLDGVNYVEGNENKVNLKLYSAEFDGKEWGNLKALPFNSDDYSVGHPALSVDEKTLYFTSNMPGSLGQTDIFKVSILKNGYGSPENLGSIINTEGREMFPFVSADNVLYFSSDGHSGLGLLDIFKSSKKGGAYMVPENMKSPFNSNRDDFSFYINEGNTYGFISSNRIGGKGDDDIYGFTLKAVEKNVVTENNCEKLLAGIVTDSDTGMPLATSKVILTKDGKFVKELYTNDKGAFDFGKYSCKGNYELTASKKNYNEGIEKVVMKIDSDPKVKVHVKLQPLVVGRVLVINPIYFNYGKHFIRPDAKLELDRVVRILKTNPDVVIKIESHTDSRSSKQFNIALSDRRAKSTLRYILSKGVEGSRIQSALGYGEERLLNGCDDNTKCSEEEHQLNRRSYFIVVKGASKVSVSNKKPEVIDSKY